MYRRKTVRSEVHPQADKVPLLQPRRPFAIALVLVVLLFLTGCSAFVDHDQTNVLPDAAVVLEPGRPVGQTFVARHGGRKSGLF